MKVLFIAEDCPCPPDNGGRLRTYHLLKRLCQQHEITLIIPSVGKEDVNLAFNYALQQVITVSTPNRISLNMLRLFFTPFPWTVLKQFNPSAGIVIERILGMHSFDLLHCDSTLIAHSIPVDASLPKVLGTHNVESVIWERFLSEERRPWMIPILRSQLAKVTKYESEILPLFDCCATVSNQDLKELHDRYGCKNTRVVPNGVDLDLYTPLSEPCTPTIAFIGSLDYRPNKDAVCWFVKSIWPLIRARIPEVQMLLVGRKPPHWLEGSCRQAGISIHANVPDTRPYLAQAALIVVPVRVGGGTRIKILEAMAAGKCVVSTSIGAEGIDVHDGQHLAIADDPAEFAQTVISLLRDPIRRKALAREGRALVEAKYCWDQAALQLENIWYEELANRNEVTI